jgi:predicted AAA+ superfamily ATPase
MILRIHLNNLKKRIFSGKAIILLGARQTGKTTLVKQLAAESGEPSLYINCDEPGTQSVLENISTEKWKQIIGNNKIIVIDEAQRIRDIGIKLKLLLDNIKGISNNCNRVVIIRSCK